jgi:bis(5'-nucleosidyl)-tetraphosphatase
MALSQRSAGIITFRLPRESGEIDAAEFLLLDYGRYWDYPKGHVESGECDQATARRELLEEIGIAHAELLPGFAHELTYFFRSKRGLVRKTVMFFLGRVPPNAAVRLSHEHTDYAWLRYPGALDRLTYASAKNVLRAAWDFLEAREKRMGVGGQ